MEERAEKKKMELYGKLKTAADLENMFDGEWTRPPWQLAVNAVCLWDLAGMQVLVEDRSASPATFKTLCVVELVNAYACDSVWAKSVFTCAYALTIRGCPCIPAVRPGSAFSGKVGGHWH